MRVSGHGPARGYSSTSGSVQPSPTPTAESESPADKSSSSAANEGVPGDHDAPPASSNFTPLTGSAKLFHDAQLEQHQLEEGTPSDHLRKPHRTTKPKLSKLQKLHTEHLQFQYPNWTGEESVEDAVLRMLVDKYKPLRTGHTQTAEERLRREPPKILSTAPTTPTPMPTSSLGLESEPTEEDSKSDIAEVKAALEQRIGTTNMAWQPPIQPTKTGSWSSEPLLPSNAAHMPWHTTYKTPSTATIVPSIKLATPLSGSPTSNLSRKDLSDSKARKMKRDRERRNLSAGRLGQAREATLDYRLGIKGGSLGGGGPPADASSLEGMDARVINPRTMKGWTSLVEDKIEKARKSGAFVTIQGRGKPLTRSTDEHNPFIAREEFFLNRIVQRNGAVPPWVELQTELEDAVGVFRKVLQESWVRAASTGISAALPPPSSTTQEGLALGLPSVGWISKYRDKAWEESQRAYHTLAVEELNGLVRKYNGMAPYPVRRGVYTLDAERERVYRESVDLIFQNLMERGRKGTLSNGSRDAHDGDVGAEGELAEGAWTIMDMVRAIIYRVFGRWLKK